MRKATHTLAWPLKASLCAVIVKLKSTADSPINLAFRDAFGRVNKHAELRVRPFQGTFVRVSQVHA